MNIDKVLTFTPFIDRGVRFALKIRVDIACCALDLGGIHACADAYALEQIDSGHDAALYSVFLFKRRQSRAAALAPKPYRVCGKLALGNPFFVHRVILQNIVALAHHGYELFGIGRS